MIVGQGRLAEILLYALFLGVFLGAVYDLFRVRRRYFSLIKPGANKRIAVWAEYTVIFIEDILFSLVCSVSVCVFIYYMNSGRLRSVSFLGTGIGFILYYNTLGRLVMKASGVVIRFLKVAFSKTLNFVILPVLKIFIGLYMVTLGVCVGKLETAVWEYCFLVRSRKGFGFLKKKDRIKYEKANKHIRKGGNLRFYSVLHSNNNKDAV